MTPLSVRLAKAMEFDEVALNAELSKAGDMFKDEALSIGEIECAKHAVERLQPFLEVLIQCAEVLASLEVALKYPKGSVVSTYLDKLRSLLDAKEG